MHRLLWALVCIIFYANSLANTTVDEFPAFQSFAKQQAASPLHALQQFNPAASLPHYTENPAETAHYTGIEVEKVDLASVAQTALKNDPGGKTIVENFGNKPRFEINKNNPDIQQALKTEANSYAITHGVSNDQVHCDAKPATQCTPTSHQETCKISRQLPDQQCPKQRQVAVTSDNINQAITIEFWIPKKWTGQVSINLITGSGGSVSNKLVMPHACSAMTASINSILNNRQPAYWVKLAGMPTCQNNATITFAVTEKFSRVYPVQVYLTVNAKSYPFVTNEQWDNHCISLEQNGLCHVKNSLCTDSTPTRVINGLPVTRDCWETSTTFSCSSAKVDECVAQKERGCLPLSSHCVNPNEAQCLRYEQVYQCTDKDCPPEIVCTHDVFCADGECVDKISSQNENFGKDIGTLAATNAAGREFSQTQASLFAGHVAQCKVWPLDLIDCCSNKGWGKSLDLLHCRDEDKALGQAKLNYLVHYLGKFCAKEELGVCIEHKRSYCVFDSKMARIIQEGRLTQLNPHAFGTAKNPTCAGMGVDELQRLDMGRVEFVKPVYPYGSNEALEAAGIVGDIQPNFPSNNQTTAEITRRIQHKAGG